MHSKETTVYFRNLKTSLLI